MTKENKEATYTCANCKGVFGFGRSEEEAEKEMQEEFPGLNKEAAAIVCDDCFKQMQKFYSERGGFN